MAQLEAMTAAMTEERKKLEALAQAAKKAYELDEYFRYAPKQPDPLPDYKAILEELRRRIHLAMKFGDYAVAESSQREAAEIQRKMLEEERRFNPQPQPYFDSRDAPENQVQEARAYYVLKTGQKVSAEIRFKGPLYKEHFLLGVEQFINLKPIGSTIQGIRQSGASFTFGYWPTTDTFRGEDYSGVLPEDYPGIFKVAFGNFVGERRGNGYYEVRLQEI